MPEQQQQNQPSDNACEVCSRAFPPCFEIWYTGRDGVKRPKPVKLCSVRCITVWSYRYAAGQGVRMVHGVRQIVDRLTKTGGA